jgi:hypothetical protein
VNGYHVGYDELFKRKPLKQLNVYRRLLSSWMFRRAVWLNFIGISKVVTASINKAIFAVRTLFTALVNKRISQPVVLLFKFNAARQRRNIQ